MNPFTFFSLHHEMVDTQNDQTLDLLSSPRSRFINDDHTQSEETLEFHTAAQDVHGLVDMEVDEEEFVFNGKTSLFPSFLRKILVKDGVGNAANGGYHRFLAIGIHAILLEFGFVYYDPVSGLKLDKFHLSGEWPSRVSTVSFCYTVAELLTSEIVEGIVLKFQTMGDSVNVYGLLPYNGFRLHQFSLDELRLVHALDFLMNHMNAKDPVDTEFYDETKVFEFWMNVRNEFALPLLTDLCEKVGLVPPMCFMRLPTELKYQILDLLPAVDFARLACVCSELRSVSSNNDIWRQKWVRQFGITAGLPNNWPWKAMFALTWSCWKNYLSRGLGFRPMGAYAPALTEPDLWVPKLLFPRLNSLR
ncbi:hypothetical protein Ancab_017582 [Ancistrocladus abbreviatus]